MIKIDVAPPSWRRFKFSIIFPQKIEATPKETNPRQSDLEQEGISFFLQRDKDKERMHEGRSEKNKSLAKP